MNGGGILSLDLGGIVGFASALVGEQPVYGSHRLPGERGDAAYFDHFANWLGDQITVFAPRLLVYEAPIITGTKTSFQTAFRLIGLAAITLMVAHRREVRKVVAANNSTIKKFATGDGRAEKIRVIEAMRARGWNPLDSNAADALAMLLWAEAKWAPEITRAAGPLFARASA